MMALRSLEEKIDPARQAEIKRLLAEQEADDTSFVLTNGAVSLDAQLQTSEGDGATLGELQGDLDDHLTRLVGEHVEIGSDRKARLVTPERISEWRHLRNKRGWTYQAIADHAGVQVLTVRKHVAGKSKFRRVSEPQLYLLERLPELRVSYEAGASLREIAQVHYTNAGYGSWQSCYQGLRKVLKRNGIELRPKHTPRHGMCSRDASLKDQKEYWRHNNQRAKARRQETLVRCDATTKEGRPCRRWAVLGGRYCMNHDERTKRQPKWTSKAITDALQSWTTEHGHPPKAQDWRCATENHPTFKTVTDLFGKWNFALYEAGLRERKHPKKRKEGRRARLAKGYKPCDREGCENTVPPAWRYCRNRYCQDQRFAERAV